MNILAQRRRALLMGGVEKNGLVNGTYYNQDQSGSIVVTNNNTTTLTGSITTAGAQIPLKKPVQTTSGECYIYQTYNSYATTIGVRFYFSDNTSTVVTKTSVDISSNPGVHFAIPAYYLGKTLVGFGFGSSQGWTGQTITWTLVVDGKTIF